MKLDKYACVVWVKLTLFAGLW